MTVLAEDSSLVEWIPLVPDAGLNEPGRACVSANAADLGGDCCADLEERVAELEATIARKGNRKVSLTLSGVQRPPPREWLPIPRTSLLPRTYATPSKYASTWPSIDATDTRPRGSAPLTTCVQPW